MGKLGIPFCGGRIAAVQQKPPAVAPAHESGSSRAEMLGRRWEAAQHRHTLCPECTGGRGGSSTRCGEGRAGFGFWRFPVP